MKQFICLLLRNIRLDHLAAYGRRSFVVGDLTNKKSPFMVINWKRYIVPATAYFPPDMHRSIIGADELNDCVRDGNRCDLIARITETIYLFDCNDLVYTNCASGGEPEDNANESRYK